MAGLALEPWLGLSGDGGLELRVVWQPGREQLLLLLLLALVGIERLLHTWHGVR